MAAPGQAGADAVAAIPVHRAGVHLGQQPLCAPLVRRINTGGQAVAGVVHQLHRLRIAADFLDADDGTETFFAH